MGASEEPGQPLTRTAAAQAVEGIGWRYLLGALCASVPVSSLAEGLRVAAGAAGACGADADRHLRIDLRPDRVELSLQTRARAAVTGRDTELAHTVSAAVAALGADTTAGPRSRPGAGSRAGRGRPGRGPDQTVLEGRAGAGRRTRSGRTDGLAGRPGRAAAHGLVHSRSDPPAS